MRTVILRGLKALVYSHNSTRESDVFIKIEFCIYTPNNRDKMPVSAKIYFLQMSDSALSLMIFSTVVLEYFVIKKEHFF